jgi:1,4-dihydroxy-2-naphthoyl-CoA hydrolase
MNEPSTASSPTDLARALLLAQGPSVFFFGLLLLATADPIGSFLGLDGPLVVAVAGAAFALFGGGVFWRSLRPVLRLQAVEVSTPEATIGESMSESEAGDAQQRLTHERMTDFVPFAGVVGAKLVSAELERVEGRLAWSPERCTTGGVLHGGALMALADTMGGVCTFLNLPPGAQTSTSDSKTNFFRAVREGHVDSVSRPLHVGRSTIVVQTDLFDAEGRRVAQTTQTQAVIAGEHSEA